MDVTGNNSSTESAAIVRAVTVIMGTVVGLTFLFGFGNVLNLALRLGVPVWVAPLVAPAVDLSILGLLLGTCHLALSGASVEMLRPARRLLIFASVVTLALNVAEPLAAGEYGKAAFDAVGPLLLIGWSEVGPGLLQAISATRPATTTRDVDRTTVNGLSTLDDVWTGLSFTPVRMSWCSASTGSRSLVSVHRRTFWQRHGRRMQRIAQLTKGRYLLRPCASGWGWVRHRRDDWSRSSVVRLKCRCVLSGPKATNVARSRTQ